MIKAEEKVFNILSITFRLYLFWQCVWHPCLCCAWLQRLPEALHNSPLWRVYTVLMSLKIGSSSLSCT